MSFISITLIIAAILFIREEVLSMSYRKEIKEATEAYEEYRRSLIFECEEQALLPEAEGQRRPQLAPSHTSLSAVTKYSSQS